MACVGIRAGLKDRRYWLSGYLGAFWPDKLVANAVLGNNDVGRFGIVFEFLSEVLDVDPEQVSGVNIGISPDLGEQAFVR